MSKANRSILHQKTYKVLYSYETPVAAFNIQEAKFFVTEEKHSITTSRHINKFRKEIMQTCQIAITKTMPQEHFDELFGKLTR